MKKRIAFMIAGFSAGAITGILGTGGGMILIPILSLFSAVPDDSIFETSLSVMLPVCFVPFASFLFCSSGLPLNFFEYTSYLIGSGIGGILAGCYGRKIPLRWLRIAFGSMIILGGIRLFLIS